MEASLDVHDTDPPTAFTQDTEWVSEGYNHGFSHVPPLGTFTRLLKENPTEAVQKLQSAITICHVESEFKLFHQRCLTRYLCAILGVALENDNRSNATLLRTHNLSEALISLALDKRYYPPPPRLETDPEIPFTYINHSLLYMILRLFTLFMRTWKAHYVDNCSTPQDVCTAAECMQNIIQDFRNLLSRLRRTLLQTPVLVRPVRSLDDTRPSNLLAVLQDCMLETSEIMCDIPGYRDNKMRLIPWDLDLLLWMRSRGDHTREDRIFALLIDDARRMEKGPASGCVSFIFANSSDHKQLLDLMSALRIHLLSRKESNKTYAGLLELLYFVAEDRYGKIFSSLPPETYAGNPIIWVMKAIQRQMCIRPYDPFEKDILTFGLGALLRYCRHRGLDLTVTVDKYLYMHLLPYLSRLAVLCRRSPDDKQGFATLQAITLRFKAFLDRVNVSFRRSYLQILRAPPTRRCWITTLQLLRVHSHPSLGPDAPNRVVDAWLQFGQTCGFDETLEVAWLIKDSDAGAEPHPDAHPWEYCAWPSCFCHEQQPLFRLRACKGCGRAYYCGPSCQKNDWKAGHRARCSPREPGRPGE